MTYKVKPSISSEERDVFYTKNGKPTQAQRGSKAHNTVDSVTVSLRLPSTLVARLDAIAEECNCGRGSVIRHIIQNSFKGE